MGTRHVDEDRVVHIAETRYGVNSVMACEAENDLPTLCFTHGEPVDYPVTCLTCLVKHGA